MRSYRTVIVEDSEIVRERLVILLSGVEGLSVVAAIKSLDDAMGTIRHLHPDAVVLSIRDGDPCVLDLLHVIKRERPGILVIALSNTPCAPCQKRYLAEGADLFLDKAGEFDCIGPALARESSRTRQEGSPGPEK